MRRGAPALGPIVACVPIRVAAGTTAICLALALGACSGGSPVSGPPGPMSISIRVHGHRGCRGLRPENTLPAFEHAVALGVDALELDVALSRDDVLVVSHDPEVNEAICQVTSPLPGRRLRDLSWDEISTLDCGSRKNPRFPDQVPQPGARMPRLEQVLDLLPGRPGLRANIEIKTFPDRRELTRSPADFARALVEAVRKRGLRDLVIVQSFDPAALEEVRRLDSRFALSALVERRAEIEPMLRATSPAILSPRFTLLESAAEVRALRRRGLRVVPWTVNEKVDLERLISFGVDGIITDYPDRLLALLGRRGP